MENQNKQATNVVELFANRFPVGSKAWHKKYRVCYVMKAIGNQRKIKSMQLSVGIIIWEYHTVLVGELVPLANPLEVK